jgi:TolA-binding protein
MTEEELRTVLDNLLQIQSNNDYNFQILQAQVDNLQKQINDLNDLKEMFRLPKVENQNREPFEQIN